MMRVFPGLAVLLLAGCSLPEPPPPTAIAQTARPSSQVNSSSLGADSSAPTVDGVPQAGATAVSTLPHASEGTPKSMEQLGYHFVSKTFARNGTRLRIPPGHAKEEIAFIVACPTPMRVVLTMTLPRNQVTASYVLESCDGGGLGHTGVFVTGIRAPQGFEFTVSGLKPGRAPIVKVYAR